MTPTLEQIPEDEIRTLEVYQHSPIHHKFPICNRAYVCPERNQREA
jgi:hypothetical protein